MSALKTGERKLCAALTTALVCALAPASAAADALVDDAVADFPSNLTTWSVEPGVVLRKPAIEGFDGPGLPTTL